ncbi:hypothetical protein [Paenisporosarcina sp. TG20]|uniref:hypothetical protein n=1 Tax=Paenisporosarcina sp. TG20 TaxID=1211706 RepID=UPI0002DAD3DF|nr:hypothetical protein [Paenisporosarcina sp. TG20]
MDPSKEFDKLFQKMMHTERSHEARRNSLLKLQNKVGRKKRYIVPVFISISMVAVVFFLVFALINPNPSSDLAAVIGNDDKNKAAIRAVLEKEFTGPDEEYLLLVEEISRQQTDPSYEKYVGPDQPHDATELMAYIDKTYSPYFTEHGLDSVIMYAFTYHSIGVGLDYKMSIDGIEVVQSDNPNAPKNYTFTGQVEYENSVGEISQYEVKGKAICSEEGKIGRIYFDVAGLRDQLNIDFNKFGND